MLGVVATPQKHRQLLRPKVWLGHQPRVVPWGPQILKTANLLKPTCPQGYPQPVV